MPATVPGRERLSERQLAVARTIRDVGRQQGVSNQAIVVALVAAAQASGFRLLANDGSGARGGQKKVRRSLRLPHHGVGNDATAVGVFQLPWPRAGSLEELMDPEASATLFYQALEGVPEWQQREVSAAAQAVQRGAFPGSYATHEELARALLLEFDLGVTPGGSDHDPAVGCVAPAAIDCPPTGKRGEKRLTPRARRVLRCVEAVFGPHRFRGVVKRGSTPGSAHASGRAVDVGIDRWRESAGVEEGQRIADWLRAHHEELGIETVSWRARSWRVGDDQWRIHTHPKGAADPGSLHMDHVHVTVRDDAGRAGPLGRPLVVAHTNLKFNMAKRAFAQDLRRVVAHQPDLISLNEVAYRSDEQLTPAGYGMWRQPKHGADGTTVLWRADRWRPLDRGRVLIVESGPQRSDHSRAATWVTLAGAGDERLSFVSVHQMVNPAVHGPHRLLRQQIYRRGMERLNELVERLQRQGEVIVAGDFNSQWSANDPWGPRRMLGLRGLRSTMDLRGAAATHDGGGILDYVFAPVGAAITRQRVIDLASDHHLLLATVEFGDPS